VDGGLGGRRLTRERQGQADRALRDRDVAHEAQRHDVLLAVGVLDATQRVHHLLFARHTPGLYPTVPMAQLRSRLPILIMATPSARRERAASERNR
jgi:hypothetical protein